MAKALVIVESPAKAKTINKYLGKDYVVKASLGHIKDLPKRDLAVDVENGFEPRYEVIEGKKKLVAELKQAAAKRRDQLPAAAVGLSECERVLLRALASAPGEPLFAEVVAAMESQAEW